MGFLLIVGSLAFASSAQALGANPANSSAVHPVTLSTQLASELGRVASTQAFPPDLDATLRGQAPAFILETSTAPACLPCADLWAKLGQFRGRYGWHVAVLNHDEAMLRSGRLGLPWVGDPVVWVRPIGDENRTIPIAIGTDHLSNLTRNAYLAVKMLTGVRPAVAVRGMARFTGIVGAAEPERAGIR